MHSPTKQDLQTAASTADPEGVFDSELRILRDVFRLLTDAAAALLQMAAAAPAPSQANDRRDTCLELLRSGRTAVLEESITAGAAKRVFLTSHRPIRVAERNLLLSSSADITE